MEVDIVMPAGTHLSKAHDISQLLQDKIEVLPRVERAFVHVDHETSHTPVRGQTLGTGPRVNPGVLRNIDDICSWMLGTLIMGYVHYVGMYK